MAVAMSRPNLNLNLNGFEFDDDLSISSTPSIIDVGCMKYLMAAENANGQQKGIRYSPNLMKPHRDRHDEDERGYGSLSQNSKELKDILETSAYRHELWMGKPDDSLFENLYPDQTALPSYKSRDHIKISINEEIIYTSISLLKTARPTPAIACYYFQLILLKRERCTPSAEILLFIADSSFKVYKHMLSELVHRCLQIRRLGYTNKNKDVLLESLSYPLNQYCMKLYPAFSFSPCRLDEERKSMEFRVQLTFELICNRSILDNLRKCRTDCPDNYENIVAGLKGVQIMNTAYKDTFVIKKVHLSKNVNHECCYDKRGNRISIKKYWESRFKIEPNNIYINQPLLECEHFGTTGSSYLFLLPQYSFPYGPSALLTTDPVFLDSLKKVCEFSFQRCEGYLRSFLIQFGNSLDVRKELKKWGVKFQIEERTEMDICTRLNDLQI